MTTVSATDRLLIGAKEVARLLSIVPSTLWSWHSVGKLPAPIRLGGRTLWRRADEGPAPKTSRAFVEAAPAKRKALTELT